MRALFEMIAGALVFVAAVLAFDYAIAYLFFVLGI